MLLLVAPYPPSPPGRKPIAGRPGLIPSLVTKRRVTRSREESASEGAWCDIAPAGPRPTPPRGHAPFPGSCDDLQDGAWRIDPDRLWAIATATGDELAIDKQKQRKIDRQLQSESRWLQKVLFALGKAREAREKLADTEGSKPDPLVMLDDGTKLSFEDLEKPIQARVEELLQRLGQGKHRLPK